MAATSVISKREVPKDLQGIAGVKTGFHPVPIGQSRMVITGSPGSGKSTLLNSFPGLFMIDPEGGGDTVADPVAIRYTVPPTVPDDQIDLKYLEVIERLIERRRSGKTDIQMIGIDTYDELIYLSQKALCRRENIQDVGDYGGGHGKGYFKVRDMFWDAITRAHKVGLGWAIIAHTKRKHVEVGGTTVERVGLVVSDSYQGILWQRCEHMLFLERSEEQVQSKPITKLIGGKKKTIPGKKRTVEVRILKTRPGGLWQGGDAQDVKVRIPLPPRIVIPENNSFGALAEAYEKAIKDLIGEK